MKQAQEIYRDMMDVFRNKTGIAMTDSSDLAVRLYAAAAELESLYVYGDWILEQSFPQTATGEHLDLHARLRGLSRRGAAAAVGSIRFFLDSARQTDVVIPAGTVCLTAGLVRFVTTEEAVIPAGETQTDVPARAEDCGRAGNGPAGSVTTMALPPAGVSRCGNPLPFTGGADEETDEELRLRVLNSFVRLPNGANAAFYEERVRAMDGVGGVQVLPRNRGAGTVDVVVAGPAGPADTDLIQRIQNDLDSLREISVDVAVLAPQTASVNVTVTVWPTEEAAPSEASEAVTAAIAGFFTGARLGKPVYLAELGSLIYATGLVRNYVIAAPAEDLAAQDGVLPVLGTLSVTEET